MIASSHVSTDACHPDAAYPSHRAGALYDLYTPTEVAVRPAGAWNTSRIVADGPTIEHWLNGRRIIEAAQGSAEWNARSTAVPEQRARRNKTMRT